MRHHTTIHYELGLVSIIRGPTFPGGQTPTAVVARDGKTRKEIADLLRDGRSQVRAMIESGPPEGLESDLE